MPSFFAVVLPGTAGQPDNPGDPGHGGAKREAEDAKVEFLGEIPLDVAIRDTSDAGQPITATRPDSKHAEAFREIARKVWAKVSGEGARKPPRIVVQ